MAQESEEEGGEGGESTRVLGVSTGLLRMPGGKCGVTLGTPSQVQFELGQLGGHQHLSHINIINAILEPPRAAAVRPF